MVRVSEWSVVYQEVSTLCGDHCFCQGGGALPLPSPALPSAPGGP
jgi:hypothetical protein